jgi:hypothetical protein
VNECCPFGARAIDDLSRLLADAPAAQNG